MTKINLSKPFPVFIHVLLWSVYFIWISYVNIFKSGWGHLVVLAILIPVMLGIAYAHRYAIRHFLFKGFSMADSRLWLTLAIFLLLLLLGYLWLYIYPNKAAQQILKDPQMTAVGWTTYFMDFTAFYCTFAFKGLGLSASETVYNIVQRRVKNRSAKQNSSEKEAVITIEDEQQGNDHFLISGKKGSVIYKVTFPEIIYIEAREGMTRLWVSSTKYFELQKTFREVLSCLPEDTFMKVHRSFAISLPHFKGMEGNRILLHNIEQKIPRGRKTNNALFDKWLNENSLPGRKKKE